jgi:hypothetical protein
MFVWGFKSSVMWRSGTGSLYPAVSKECSVLKKWRVKWPQRIRSQITFHFFEDKGYVLPKRHERQIRTLENSNLEKSACLVPSVDRNLLPNCTQSQTNAFHILNMQCSKLRWTGSAAELGKVLDSLLVLSRPIHAAVTVRGYRAEFAALVKLVGC